MKNFTHTLIPLLMILLAAPFPKTGVNADAQEPADSSSQSGWRVFSPPDKAFSVEFPSEPRHDSDDPLSAETLTGESYTALDASSDLNFLTISIICTAKLKAEGISPNALLDSLVEMVANTPHKLVSSSHVEVDGLPGREFVSANSRGNDYARGRLINADSRIYMLVVIAAIADDLYAPSVTRFLNSFHVNRTPSPLSPLPGCASHEARLPSISQGVAGLVRFPEPWIESDRGSERTLLTPQWYEIRSGPNASDREMLFAGMTGSGYWGEIYSDRSKEKPKASWYGINFYAVNPDDGFHVRPVGQAEWTRAARISLRPKKLFPQTQDDLKLDAFEYRGRKFNKSSEHWGSVLLSPSGRWLAVYSYSGQNTPVFLFGGGVPREGDIYWDIRHKDWRESAVVECEVCEQPGLTGGGRCLGWRRIPDHAL